MPIPPENRGIKTSSGIPPSEYRFYRIITIKTERTMTKEDARKAAEVMLAYAEGKEVNVRAKGTEKWQTIDVPAFNWCDFAYCIKSSPKYRPFQSAEECWQEMQKHQPFGWVKEKNADVYLCVRYVTEADEEGELPLIRLTEEGVYEYSTKEILESYAFVDGTPCGVKEDAE